MQSLAQGHEKTTNSIIQNSSKAGAIGDSSPVWELETAFPVSCLTFMLPQSDTGREKVKKTDCVYLRDVRSQKKAKKNNEKPGTS